jgi:hypothetical protein
VAGCMLSLLLVAYTMGVISAPPDGPEPRLTGARGELGIGAPTGTIGVVLWRDVAPALRLEAGTGWGLSGLQLSGFSKLVLGGQHHRFVTGAGLSVGIPLGEPVFRDHHGGSPVAMPWLNADLAGYEYMGTGGWTFSVALGATAALRKAHWDLVDDFGGNLTPLRSWFPAAHLAFGQTF